jgi:hypothetical protein
LRGPLTLTFPTDFDEDLLDFGEEFAGFFGMGYPFHG